MSNLATLKSFNTWDKEEHRLVCCKGGLASVEARRKKKQAIKDKFGFHIDMELLQAIQSEGKFSFDEIQHEYIVRDRQGKLWTLASALASELFERSLRGSVGAMQLVMSYLYGKPKIYVPE